MAINNESAPLCSISKKCSGCQLMNMDYARQLAWKENGVRALLGRFAPVNRIIGMDDPFHYRNKVQAAFGLDRNGRIISGVYQSSTHRIAQTDSCLLEDKKADEIIVSIRKMLRSFKITVYDEVTERGFLRHVLVRRGAGTGEIMVVLVSASPIFPAKRAFCEELLKKHPEITTIVHNICTSRVSLLLGNREEVLYGKGYIEDTLCGCRFRISSRSFYQVNPVQTEVLYGKAVEMAGLSGDETVLDAYCGIGTIGLIASKKAKQVIGVEINRDAVRDAIANAKSSGIKNAWFTCADASRYITDAARDGNKADVVFMDPPRAGSDEIFLSAVCEMAPKKIVYISCNPETQARDLEYLTASGYRVREIQPVDMFPYTKHVETVVLLSRN